MTDLSGTPAGPVASAPGRRGMSRNKRRKLLTQGLAYLVLLAIVALVAFKANWAVIDYQFFNRETLRDMWPDIVTVGVVNTIKYTAIAFAIGLSLAFVLALMRLSSVAGYRWIATVFVEVFRGLPALVVILLFALGVPLAFKGETPGSGFKWPEVEWLGLSPTITGGLLALILVSSAYMAETLRAGIQAVPSGQIEAARSLGMGQARTMFTVVLPQAIRIVIPPMTNEFILLLKDTALLGAVGMLATQQELTEFGRSGLTSYANPTPLIAICAFYLIISIPVSQLVAWLERRQQRTR